MNRVKTLWLVGLALVVLTVVAFLPVLEADFINYDDPDYVTANEVVRNGLSGAGMAWAFTTGHAGNWHPVTWLSHLLDVSLFGMKPVGHHAVSLAFHAVNALLLLLVLHSMTASLGRSALVAAFFALHPLRVESVAWISERKDVLSGFFGLLCLLAYACYVKKLATLALSSEGNPRFRTESRGRAWAYGISLICFAFGLMCKPMLVTWPFILLLLDKWPLQRLESWRFLVREKIPFLALALAVSVVTFLVQQHGGAMEANYPLGDRLANVPVALVRYLWKTVWPAALAVFYPFPAQWPLEQVVGATILIGVITGLAIWGRKHWPFVTMGWLWFVGMLVPTMGLVQVGGASMADRYTYLPSIGLFIGMTWMISQLAPRSLLSQRMVACGACVALMLLTVTTFDLTRIWRNSRLLWQHALAVTTQNEVAHNNLGAVLQGDQDWEGARQHYEAALAIKSSYYADAHCNLGNVLARLGRFGEGRPHLLKAIALRPTFAPAHFALAALELDAGNLAAAEQAAREALRLKPNWFEAHKLLGNIFVNLRQFTNGVEEFSAALNLNANDVDTRFNLASALRESGRSIEAIGEYGRVLQARPDDLDARRLLAAEQARTGDLSGAITNLTEAVRLCPDATNELQLAQLLVSAGRSGEAIPHYRETLRLKPEWALACNNLAWSLATSADPTVRNGEEAVHLAERACTSTDYREPVLVGTLAAAYAEAGRFDDAIATAEKAIVLAEAVSLNAIAVRNRELLNLYRQGKPFHESP